MVHSVCDAEKMQKFFKFGPGLLYVSITLLLHPMFYCYIFKTFLYKSVSLVLLIIAENGVSSAELIDFMQKKK